MGGEVYVEIILQQAWATLQKNKSADGRLLYGPDTAGMLAALVDNGLMDEMGDVILLKAFGKQGNFAVMYKQIAPT